jgi:Flp pilus assembly protein TadD
VATDDASSLDDIGARFEIALLEENARLREGEIDALRHLAYAYSAAGRHEDALAADRRLVQMEPERGDLHYDLACSLALVGRVDEAFLSLGRAIDLGGCDRDLLTSDADLASLRGDARWAELLRRADPSARGT